MFKKVKEKLKGVKRYMDEKIQMARELLSSNNNELTLGFILIGVGIGLVSSVYAKVPASVN